MTTSPLTPATNDAAVQDPGEGLTDMVLAGRAVSTGQRIAGLMLAAELETVGTPRKLPMDLFPDVDPVVVQEIWERACVVAWRASQFAAAPRFHRDKLARLQGQLMEAGHEAMGGMVARAARLASSEGLAVDAESAREH